MVFPIRREGARMDVATLERFILIWCGGGGWLMMVCFYGNALI